MSRSEEELAELKFESLENVYQEVSKGDIAPTIGYYEPKLEVKSPTRSFFIFPPTSIEQAEAQSLDLMTQILEIEAQLGDRTREDSMFEDVYWEWRKKAIEAKTIKTVQRAKLRAWLKKERTPKATAEQTQWITG